MEMVNGLYAYKEQKISGSVIKEAVENLLLLLAPFAPHMTEELWEKLGKKESIHLMPWPKYDIEAMVEEEIEIVVQVNGKVKGKVSLPAEATDEEMKQAALSNEKVLPHIEGKNVVKVITVPRKLVNIVVK
jgi:leucyl-tRNA synthetase